MQRLVMRQRRQQRGYNLVELAILVTVVGLLTGATLVPLGWLWEAEVHRNEQQAMQSNEDALLGYALTHSTQVSRVELRGIPRDVVAAEEEIPAGRPYLPCPDLDGDGYEDRNDRTIFIPGVITPTPAVFPLMVLGDSHEGLATQLSCREVRGVLPWKTLGVPPADSWGNRYTYQVDDLFADAAVGFNHESIPNNVEPRELVVLLDNLSDISFSQTLIVAFTATTAPGAHSVSHTFSTQVTLPNGNTWDIADSITVGISVAGTVAAIVTPVSRTYITNTLFRVANDGFVGNYVYQSRHYEDNFVSGSGSFRIDRIPRLVCSIVDSVLDVMCRENLYNTRGSSFTFAGRRRHYTETTPLGVAIEGPVYVIVSHGENGYGAVNHWRSAQNSVVCNPPVDSTVRVPVDNLDLSADTVHLEEVNNYPFLWSNENVADRPFCRFVAYGQSQTPFSPVHFNTAPRRNVQSNAPYFDDVVVWSMRQKLFQHLVAAQKLPAPPLPIFRLPRPIGGFPAVP